MEARVTSQALKALTAVERFNFYVTNTLNRTPLTRRLLTRLLATLGTAWVEFGTSRTVLDHGFDNFAKIDPNRAVLLVANHRTFYDQFVISARLFRLYGPHHNVYFPVRANFFYDNPLGLLVNLPVAMGVMYPPFVRDRKRLRWNAFATNLLVELLQDPHNMVGFHPEGTRNRGPDPYELLPAKPGCGELIYRSRPNVLPVFLQGFPKNAFTLVKANLRRDSSPFVHMVMGEPLDFSEELQLPAGRKTYLLISRKVMQRIAELSQLEREIRQRYQ